MRRLLEDMTYEWTTIQRKYKGNSTKIHFSRIMKEQWTNRFQKAGGIIATLNICQYQVDGICNFHEKWIFVVFSLYFLDIVLYMSHHQKL